MINPSFFLPLFIFLAIFSGSALGTGWLRPWLEAQRVIDQPNQRSAHAQPKPRGGGLPIVFSTLLVALGAGYLNGQLFPALAYALGGILIAWIGWLDDRRSLSPKVRFLAQGCAAMIVMLGLGWFRSIHVPVFGDLTLGWWGIPISFLWILGVTNAFNFMDGIDGITGLVGGMAGLAWMLIAAATSLANPLTFWISLSLTAGSLGFLLHNWHPSKIFIGDVCSTFLGFSFAVLPLFSSSRSPAVFLAGTAILWAYIFDTGLTFLRRLLKREPVFSAHRSHIYQRLDIAGLPVPVISLLYGALTLAGGLLTLGYLKGWLAAEYLMIPGMPLAWTLLWLYSRHVSKA